MQLDMTTFCLWMDSILYAGISNTARDEGHALGTASAPYYVVEKGLFKKQLLRSAGGLLVTGVAIYTLEHLEDVQVRRFEALKEVPRDSGTKLSDVKGVDEAKADLEDIVHYLRDPKVSFIVVNLGVQMF